jgi:hypothetical protein
MLFLEEDGVRVKMFKTFIDEPWKEISGLSAEGPDQVATRFTATRFLLAGPLALAWKKEKKLGFVVATGSFGEFTFQVKKKTPQELRALLAPWSPLIAPRPAARDWPYRDESARQPAEPVSTPADASDVDAGMDKQRQRLELLRELGELHQSGVLTDEEFQEHKARILEEFSSG